MKYGGAIKISHGCQIFMGRLEIKYCFTPTPSNAQTISVIVSSVVAAVINNKDRASGRI